MIRCIAAIDAERGLANERGIPWQGKLPGDSAYFRRCISDGNPLLMGKGTYLELSKAFRGGANYVLSHQPLQLKAGFAGVTDLAGFLKEHFDVWILGGAGVFKAALPLSDELYLTQLRGSYGCTKFFPPYLSAFMLERESELHEENGIHYLFQVWKRKP